MTTKTAKTTAALVLALGVALGGATTAPAAVASPIRECAKAYIAKGYTSRDAVQKCSRELAEDAKREAAERRAERESTATTTRKPAVSVVKPTDIPGSNTPYVSNQPRNWWDSLPTWTHGAMIGAVLIALLWVIGYLVGKRAEVQERRQQAAEFAAGGGYDTAAAPDSAAAVDYPTDHPDDYTPPPEPQYHVPEQQTPPPAYAEPHPQPEQRPQTPPPTTNSGGSSASAFDDLI